MASMITFAANNDLFRKRKRVYRACEQCKKRRKRCTHTFDDAEDADISLADEVHSAVINSTAEKQDSEIPRFNHAPRPQREPHVVTRDRSASPSQFYGHTRPEALFLDQTTGASTVSHECGYWMPGNLYAKSSSRKQEVDDAEDHALKQYLAVVNVELLPPQGHLDALIKIYFEYVHPILPLVDPTRPGRRKNGKLLSPMLLQTICIIASRHDQAAMHLVLNEDGKVFEPRDFAKKLYRSVNAALNAKLEKDRSVLIQVLALLSQYAEGTEGAEVASMHLSEAIHHAHTIGMQFGRARDDERAEYFNNFYWCLWSLDRVNSTINGRPVFISDADSRLDSPLAHEGTKHTPFGIYLQITFALDHIINYYRPRHDSCTGWEKEFPGFESMLGDKSHDINPSILAFLELFYHSAAIMSHKAKSIHDPIPATPSFVRQSLSTVRVMQILRDECPSDHPSLPIVPWSASLAMTHAYRVFRQSKIPTLRSRANNDMRICCDLLHKMRIHWWAAGTMAELGRAALKKAAAGRENTDGRVRNMPKESATNNHTGVQLPPIASTPPGDVVDCVSTATTSTDPLTTPYINPDDNISMLDPTISPDWLNFDTAFENFDALLGSSGPDVSMELLRPFKFDEFASYTF